MSDLYTNSMCSKTAQLLVRLMELRGLHGCIEWKESAYWVNGFRLGTSVHSVIKWMDSQTGVKP